MKALVISASSDIGHALAMHWVAQGWGVAGTFRTPSEGTAALERAGVRLVRCDLDDREAVNRACAELAALLPAWDVLVVCPATLEPIGEFLDCRFDEWAASVERNFTAQMRCIHALLPSRSRQTEHGPCVITWAGSGTNSAPKAFSAYTVSKVAQIKMMELLDAEVPDARFVIVGPGWVRTKIHAETLKAGARAGDTHEVTVSRLAAEETTAMTSVVACCDWIVGAARDVVSGRNFSVVHDAWGRPALADALRRDRDMYKLRRRGNGWRP